MSSVFESTSKDLIDWLSTLGPDAQVLLDPAVEPDKAQLICAYLVCVLPGLPLSGSGSQSISVVLRYLITISGGESVAQYGLLERLIVAARANGSYQLVLGSIDPQIWLTFGLRARPGFLLEIPVLIEGSGRVGPAVTSAPEVTVKPVHL